MGVECVPVFQCFSVPVFKHVNVRVLAYGLDWVVAAEVVGVDVCRCVSMGRCV